MSSPEAKSNSMDVLLEGFAKFIDPPTMVQIAQSVLDAQTARGGGSGGPAAELATALVSLLQQPTAEAFFQNESKSMPRVRQLVQAYCQARSPVASGSAPSALAVAFDCKTWDQTLNNYAAYAGQSFVARAPNISNELLQYLSRNVAYKSLVQDLYNTALVTPPIKREREEREFI